MSMIGGNKTLEMVTFCLSKEPSSYISCLVSSSKVFHFRINTLPAAISDYLYLGGVTAFSSMDWVVGIINFKCWYGAAGWSSSAT